MRFIVVLVLLCLAGCSSKPVELRGLKLVTVTVQDDGNPLEGILVLLTPKEVQFLRGCNGVTDSKGKAIIRTSVRQRSGVGAAPGEYKVLLQQTFAMPDDFEAKGTTSSPQEQEILQAKRKAWIDKHRTVPEIFEQNATTPIELTVDESNGGQLVVDVAKYKTTGP